jgi:hypothetical protein
VRFLIDECFTVNLVAVVGQAGHEAHQASHEAKAMTEPINNYIVTSHAAFEIHRRRIEEDLVRRVLAAPEQCHAVRPGRDVLQSRIAFDGKTYLLRVFVDIDRDPVEVVTVYRTSRIAKYWVTQP